MNPLLILLLSVFILVILAAAVCCAAIGARTKVTTRSVADAYLVTEYDFVLATMFAFGPLTEGEYLLWLVPSCIAIGYLAVTQPSRYLRVAFLCWLVVAAYYLGPTQGTTLASDTLIQASTGITLLSTGRVGFLLLIVTLFTAQVLHRGLEEATLRTSGVEHAGLPARSGCAMSTIRHNMSDIFSRRALAAPSLLR